MALINIKKNWITFKFKDLYYNYTQYDKYDSSRIVEISFMLCNEKLENIESKDFIVKRDFLLSNSEINYHIENSIPFTEIAKILSKYLNYVSHIIFYDAKLNYNILFSELSRYNLGSIIETFSNRRFLSIIEYTNSLVNISHNNFTLSEIYDMIDKNNHIYNDLIKLHNISKKLYDINKLYDYTSYNDINYTNAIISYTPDIN